MTELVYSLEQESLAGETCIVCGCIDDHVCREHMDKLSSQYSSVSSISVISDVPSVVIHRFACHVSTGSCSYREVVRL